MINHNFYRESMTTEKTYKLTRASSCEETTPSNYILGVGGRYLLTEGVVGRGEDAM
jgi:hypothetical protein